MKENSSVRREGPSGGEGAEDDASAGSSVSAPTAEVAAQTAAAAVAGRDRLASGAAAGYAAPLVVASAASGTANTARSIVGSRVLECSSSDGVRCEKTIIRNVIIPRSDPATPTSSFKLDMKRTNEFYGGATFVGKDYFHASLLGKLPRGKLLCEDVVVGVNGTAVFDVDEERPTCDFDSVIDRMRSTGPGKPLDLDVMRLSSQPIPRRVRVTKLLPKYVASSSSIIFSPALLQTIRDKVNASAGADASNESSSLSTSELSIDAEDSPSDRFSIVLTVAGWTDLVEATKGVITDVLHSHVICHKQNALLRSNDNIELDLRLDPGRTLGLYLGENLGSALRRSTRGVWFKLQSGEQMSTILGQAAALGGVLLKIGDRTVDSIDDATSAWTSLTAEGSEVVVTVCIHKDADTRSVNRSHLVREPRRRGGGAYRGSLHIPPASTSGSNSSGMSSSKRKRKLSDGDDSDERNRKATFGADDNGGSSREVSVSNNISLNVHEYQRFRAKMSRTFDVEFKAHGFQRSAVIKSTWSLHKSLIGDTCGDDCSCLSRLREICANVVKDHLKRKQEEEGAQWTNPLKLRFDAFPIGFISRFVPKFISRVQKEMPKSTSTEVLDVLIQMWSKHKKATCSSSCACQDDWERTFKPKVVDAMKLSVNSMSSSVPSSQVPPMGRQASKGDSSVASLRNSHEVVGTSRSPSLPAEPAIIPKRVAHPSGATATVVAKDTKSPSLLSNLLPDSVEKPFVVTFDTSFGLTKPLGLFFVTDRKRKSVKDETVCKVASICPYYAGKRTNAKIKVGSFVVGTAPNDSSSKGNPAMERLNSHETLKERYEAACRDKCIASFNVWFVNSDVLPSLASNAAAAGKRDWSTSGEWLGRSSKAAGWAGGAATKASASTSKRSNAKGTISNGTETLPIDSDAFTSTSSSSNASTKKKSHARTGPLLLRPDRERKTGRKVSFSRDGHETREYVIGSSVTGRVVEDSSFQRGNSVDATKATDITQNKSVSIDADDESSNAMSASPTKGATLDMDVPINVRRSKKLLDAIWNGDYRDVLRLLKEGAPVSMRDKNNLAPYDHVKKKVVELESLLREAGSDDKPVLEDSLADFKRKSILLKIYIHVEHNISLLWAIDDWQNIQIAVDSINGLTLSPEGRKHRSSAHVFCVMVLEDRPVHPTMPLLPMSSSIDLTALENRPSYYLTYNKSLPFSFKEGRLVQVDVVKGTSQVPGENLRLGSWMEKVETLRDVMLPVDATGEEVLTRDIEGSDFISGGSMTLSFRKAPLGDTFAAEKRAESARKLNTALDWIDAFQKDTDEVFDPNISLGSRDDLSILHAAVYAADKKLVDRLLGMGADPTAKGAEVGSAQDLCVSLANSSTSIEVGRSMEEIRLILDKHVASGDRPTKKRTSRWGDVKDAPNPTESEESSVLAPDPTFSSSSLTTTFGTGKKIRWAKKEEKLELKPEPKPDIPSSSETLVSDNTTCSTNSSNSRPNRWGKKNGDAASTAIASSSSQATQSSSHLASPPDLVQDALSPLPVLPSVDWIPGRQQRCRRQAKDCPMGIHCPNAHVNASLGLIIDHHPALASDRAVMMNAAIKPQYVHLKQAMDATGKIWFTAAYIDPVTNEIYYAERGTGGMKSKQAIYWYSEKGQATLAVKRVVIIATHAKEDLSKRQSVQPKVVVPQRPHYQGMQNRNLLLPPPPPPPPPPPSLAAPAPPSYAALEFQSNSGHPVLHNQQQQAQPTYPTQQVHAQQPVHQAAQVHQTHSYYGRSMAQIPPPPPPLSAHVLQTGNVALPPGGHILSNPASIGNIPPPPPPPPPPHQMNPSHLNAWRNIQSFGTDWLQPMFAKIFPSTPNLKKTCWKTHRHATGMVSVDFSLPAECSAGGTTYSSSGWNGTALGDRYYMYYSDEGQARLAAFMNFLVDMSRRRLVSPDLTTTAEGKPLFVKKSKGKK